MNDDLISRQAAIEALGEEPDIALDTEEEWAERNAWARHVRAIKSLPPANTDLSDYIDRLWEIAYERGKSERPKGEWQIKECDSIYGKKYILTCAECGGSVSVTKEALPYENFCRECGADMRGADDD